MDTSFEQKVRERAYHIWMSAGRTHGMAHEHWIIAEQAVANEIGTPPAAEAPAQAKAMSAKTVASKTAPAKAASGKPAPVRKASGKAVASRAKTSPRSAKTSAQGSTASH